jgi:hypothetical protein
VAVVHSEPAFACTTHKIQGSTASSGAVIERSMKKPFTRGLDYVAVSRPTDLSKLFLLGPLTDTKFIAFPKERNDMTVPCAWRLYGASLEINFFILSISYVDWPSLLDSDSIRSTFSFLVVSPK